MPVVKGEAFNACWLDKSSSLQPNLNTGGQHQAIRRGRRGGTPHIQIHEYSDMEIMGKILFTQRK